MRVKHYHIVLRLIKLPTGKLMIDSAAGSCNSTVFMRPKQYAKSNRAKPPCARVVGSAPRTRRMWVCSIRFNRVYPSSTWAVGSGPLSRRNSWTVPDAMEPTHHRLRVALMHPRHTRGRYLQLPYLPLAMPGVTESGHLRLGPHLSCARGVLRAAAAPISSSQTLWVVRGPEGVLSHLFNPGE